MKTFDMKTENQGKLGIEFCPNYSLRFSKIWTCLLAL